MINQQAAALQVESNNIVLIDFGSIDDLKKEYSDKKGITYLTEREWNEFDLLMHTGNFKKEDKNYKRLCEYNKRLGLPLPPLGWPVRTMHVKYSEKGEPVMPEWVKKRAL